MERPSRNLVWPSHAPWHDLATLLLGKFFSGDLAQTPLTA